MYGPDSSSLPIFDTLHLTIGYLYRTNHYRYSELFAIPHDFDIGHSVERWTRNQMTSIVIQDRIWWDFLWCYPNHLIGEICEKYVYQWRLSYFKSMIHTIRRKMMNVIWALCHFGSRAISWAIQKKKNEWKIKLVTKHSNEFSWFSRVSDYKKQNQTKRAPSYRNWN